MSAQEVGNAFVQHWYNTRGTDPNQLASLFQPQSMLSFEGRPSQGPQSIITELTKTGPAKYKADTIDIQPSVDQSSIIIFVTGKVIMSENPVQFAETFQLVSSGPGQYYVHNCIFRLNYG